MDRLNIAFSSPWEILNLNLFTDAQYIALLQDSQVVGSATVHRYKLKDHPDSYALLSVQGV